MTADASSLLVVQRQLRAIQGSRHVWPVLFVWSCFCGSRIWAWFAGVRFDGSSLSWYWQYIDPELLKHHLLQSLWYLHAQPPLYNLLLGLGLKLFGRHFDAAAYDLQLCLGFALAIALYAVMTVVGVGRWFAAAATTLFSISPAAILFENWLFYEYLVTALLVFAVCAFAHFVRRPTAARATAVFALLAAVCYIRASFQLVVLVLVLLFMVAVFWNHRRAVLLGAAVPVLLVVALSAKNTVLFGTPETSSWMGMNLVQVAQPGIHGAEEDSLEQRHLISAVSTVPTFSSLDKYSGVVPLDPRYSSVPVLSETTKSTGATNYNNINYVDISGHYLHDFIRVVTHDPGVYFHGVWVGMKMSAYPSPDYAFFLGNGAKMAWWIRSYDTVVLLQPKQHEVGGVRVGTAWGLIAYYVIALLFGAAEMVRVLLRRGGSATLALTWLILAYATTVLTFAEIEENQRVRFVGDPLAMVLVCAFVVRVAPRVRSLAVRRHTQPVRPRSSMTAG
jgi:hypothetical protein